MAEVMFFGHFCEEIRREITGKGFLIGCFGTTMIVGSFPCRIPKLALNFGAYLPPETKQGVARIDLYIDDTVCAQINFDFTITESEIYGDRACVFGGFDFMAPLFSKPCVVSAKLHLDGEVYAGPFLKVKQASQSEKTEFHLG